ncbi:M48 family metalloprotease [Novosphingobium humi]|uniref:M48 family metalloprotease n=1 Tax=Novosphingobium humi TaxID=2282397 RepID=A0ABY7TZC1_9SPHN|nr:M48 family metalloprotease [Novosphingobium humi]WCT77169.1 M48 family metalloprotease [Novosphingobium humi]
MKRLALAGLMALTAAAPPINMPGPQAISPDDRATGAKAHPDMVSEYGGAYAGPQAAMVRRVGLRVAGQSGISNVERDFTFTLLNSPVENAFAIPGGYVYTTRALLALMNNEDELGFVLGHETGHIAARHSEKRQQVAQRSTLLGALGQAVLGSVLGGGAIGQLGNQIGQAGINRLVAGHVMAYSRGEEFEADDLGGVYMQKAGYNPAYASTMLASLAAQTGLESRLAGNARTTPGWAMSHPNPEARVTRALDRARQMGIGAPPGSKANEAFLLSLRGMIYDDDPQQGVIEGQTFTYPPDRLRFTVPAGYGMSNGSDAVTITAKAGNGQGHGQGQAIFTGGAYKGDLGAVLRARFKAIAKDGQVGEIKGIPGTINGMPSMSASLRGNTGSTTMDLTVVAIAVAPERAYAFTVMQPAGQGLGDLAPLVNGFTRITPAQAAAIRPRIVDVVRAGPGDTVATMAARMAYNDNAAERFLVLNGLPAGTTRLTPGSMVKLVVWKR